MLAATTATHWFGDTLRTAPLAEVPAVRLVLAQPTNRRPSVAARALAETLLAAYRQPDPEVLAVPA